MHCMSAKSGMNWQAILRWIYVTINDDNIFWFIRSSAAFPESYVRDQLIP